MGTIDVNVWGVLVSGVASMVVGMLYYSDQAFGKEWKKLAKIDNKQFQKEMSRTMPVVFVGALVSAYIIAYVSCLYETFYVVSWLQASLITALLLWLIVATNIAVHNLLDQKPRQLTVISVGNRLLSFIAMALVLAWLHA